MKTILAMLLAVILLGCSPPTRAGFTGGSTNANMLSGVAVSYTAPASGQVLVYNGSQWSPGAAGIPTSTAIWPFVEMISAQVANGTETCTAPLGSQTSGVQIVLTQPHTMTGVNFFWLTNSSPYNVKCSLWDVAANARLASGTISGVNATGIYSCSFASAYTFSSSQQGQLYEVTFWETSGTRYSSCNGFDNYVTMPGLPFVASPYHMYASSKGYSGNNFQSTFALYASGDSRPTTAAGSESYPVEPVWQ